MSSTREPFKPFDCKVEIESELRLLVVIKDRLLSSPARLRIFKETVFAPWIYIKEKAHDNHMLNYVLHHQRCDEFLSAEAPILFDIGDHTLQLGKREFCLLTGFTCGKVVFDELKKDDIPPFIRRVFPEKVPGNGKKPSKSKNKDVSYNVKGWELKSLVKNEKSWGELSDEDAVRVCLLLMEQRVFMGQMLVDVVDNRIMMLVEDLQAWNTFPWGEYFWRKFHESVVNLVPGHIKKDQEKHHRWSTYSICGFAWVLKIWILESFPKSRYWWVKDHDVIPRCLAWRNSSQFVKKRYSELFGTDSNPKTLLTPTIEEMKHEWWTKSYHYFFNNSHSAQVDNLGSKIKRDEEDKAVGQDGGSRTIPSTSYTRILECPEGPANIVQTETHCQHGTCDTVNLQGIHSENENITLSSSDVSPMPPKPITKRQAPPTKVATPESDENVLCPKDANNFQGAATVSDCRNKRLKLSCDHGDEELLDLSGQQRELVESVSPMQDCATSKTLASPQFDTVSVQGYKVRKVNASILEAIFKLYGDIAANCPFKIASVREPILEVVCDVVRKLQTNHVTTIISEMAEIENLVSAAEETKINVSWLRAHLETIHKRNNAKKNCSLLIKTKANMSLVTRAARMDLKSAKEQFEKAERRVKVLDLVRKKLHDNLIESEAEKDSCAAELILLAN